MSELNVNDDLDAFEKDFFGSATDDPSEEVASVTNDEEGDTNEPDDQLPEDQEVDEPDESEEDEAEPDEEADDAEEEETDLFKAKRKKSAQERIRELTAARREAERREADLARRLEELEAKHTGDSNKNDTKAAPSPRLEADAPDPDETLEDGSPKYPLGEFDPHYIRDLTRFTIALETKSAKEAEAKAAREQQMQEAEKQLHTQWSEKLEAAKETLPDFGDKVVVLEDTFRDLDPNYGKYLAATIMSMDKGPEVLHYLATHISEAKSIVANGPTAATLALGRIEAQFGTTSNEKKSRSTKAPPPPPTNRGSGRGSAVSDDTDNLDAFEKKFFAKR